MATAPPRVSVQRLVLEPVRGPSLIACGLVVWLVGAAYCHGYQHLLTGGSGPWSGSLTWSAIAVVPWFALFEWSKEPRSAATASRPAILAALVVAIAGVSIGLEYLIDFCAGDIADRFGLLVMRRLPAVGASLMLILLTRKIAMGRSTNPPAVDLTFIARSIDWVEAADNYVELHLGGRILMRRMTMAEAERSLGRQGFVRIHRRFLVNRRRIEAVLGTNGDRRVRIAGTELPVGRSYLPRLTIFVAPAPEG